MTVWSQGAALAVFLLVALSIPSSNGQNSPETGTSLKVEILSRGPISGNSPAQLKCKVTGAGPNTLITWVFNGVILPSKIAQAQKDTTAISLFDFTPLSLHNGYPVECKAVNKGTNGSTIEAFDEINIDVYYTPVVNLELGYYVQKHDLVEGNDVYLECKAQANPPPSKITWQRNGVPVENNYSEGIQITSNALVLQNLSPLVDGDYTCKASNVQGYRVSVPYNLRIRYKPVCKFNETKVISAKLMESVKLECDMKAYPSPDVFQWTFNSFKQIDPEKFTVAKEQGKSVLTFTPMSYSDYGSVQCRAANSEGRQKLPCTFIIQPPSIQPPLTPQAPQRCDLNAVDNRNMLLVCTPDFSAYENKKNVTYKAEIFTDEEKKILTTAEIPLWKVNKMDVLGSKKIVLYATNEYGESQRTFILETPFRLTPTTTD